MNSALFKKELRSNFVVFIVIALVLTMYTTVIITMFDPKLGESLHMMATSMEDIFSAFGMSNPGDTLLEFMINYLYGMLYIVFPMILILILVNRLVIRYMERGTMAYLLATPNSRNKLSVTAAVTLVVILLVMMIYLNIIQIAVSGISFPGDLDITGLMKANAGLLGLWIFMGGLCYLSANIFKSAGMALWVGGGLNILFLLLQMLSQVGEKMENLKYATAMTLFDPSGLVVGDGSAIAGTTALYIVGIICFIAGVIIFRRKDMNI